MTTLIPYSAILLMTMTFFMIFIRPSIVIGAQLFGTSLIAIAFTMLGLEIKVTYTIFALALFAVIIQFFKGNSVKWFPTSTIEISVLLLVLYQFITLIWTNTPDYGKQKSLQMIGVALPCLLVARLFSETPKRLKASLELLSLYAIAVALITFAFLFSGADLGTRYRSDFFGPLELAYGAVGLISIGSYLFLQNKAFVIRIAALVTVLLSVIIVVGTGSRGAVLALLAATLLTFLRGRMLVQTLIGLTLMGALIGIVVTNYGDESGIERLMGKSVQGYDSGSGRLYLYQLGIEHFLQDPIRGGGAGSFAFHFLRKDIRLYPHNSIIEIAGETGLVGLFLFGLALFMCGKQLIRIRKYTAKGPKQPLFWELTVLQFLFFSGFVNSSLSFDLPIQRLLFVSMGFLAGVSCWKNLDSNDSKQIVMVPYHPGFPPPQGFQQPPGVQPPPGVQQPPGFQQPPISPGNHR